MYEQWEENVTHINVKIANMLSFNGVLVTIFVLLVG